MTQSRILHNGEPARMEPANNIWPVEHY